MEVTLDVDQPLNSSTRAMMASQPDFTKPTFTYIGGQHCDFCTLGSQHVLGGLTIALSTVCLSLQETCMAMRTSIERCSFTCCMISAASTVTSNRCRLIKQSCHPAMTSWRHQMALRVLRASSSRVQVCIVPRKTKPVAMAGLRP
jgi:hypothetical protein